MNAPATTTTNFNLEQLRYRLRRLGLYGLLAHAQSLMHEPWLLRVLEIAESERANRSLKRRLDNTRLGAFKPIADFDWDWPDKCDRSLIEELFSLAFVEEAANVVFIGANGLGKTMLLKNLTYQAVLKGRTARFTLASDMLHDLAAQDSSTALARRLRRYTSPALLAVDEVGYLSYDARYAGVQQVGAVGLIFIDALDKAIPVESNPKGLSVLGLYDPAYTKGSWNDIATCQSFVEMGVFYNDARDSRVCFYRSAQ